MASTHHLVRVCMFCLLCAAHSWCAAHIGMSADGAQYVGKFQELKHERFKDGYANPGREKGNYAADYEPVRAVDEDEIKRIYDRLGSYSISPDRHNTQMVKDSNGNNKIVQDVDMRLSGDGLLPENPASRLRFDANDIRYGSSSKESHQNRGRRGYYKSTNVENSYIVQVRQSTDSSRVNALSRDVAQPTLGANGDPRLFSSENPPQSRVDGHASNKFVTKDSSGGFSDKTDDLKYLSNPVEAMYRNGLSNKLDRRIKRDAHIPDEGSKPRIDEAEASARTDNQRQFKANLKNIDVDFYIKKLFTQFGSRETMTMDVAGFEQMLKELDLRRMILEGSGLGISGNVQTIPIESVVHGVRSNSSNVTCVNSVDLISSLNAQQKPLHHHTGNHRHSHADNEIAHITSNMSLDTIKGTIRLNAKILTKVCPILLYQKVAQTSYERTGCLVERDFPKSNGGEMDSLSSHHYFEPNHLGESEDEFVNETDYSEGANNRTAVWTYSCLCILAISACGLLGVAVIPIMHHTYYQQILQFLVALAVGTLSGDAMLHLLPHAMSAGGHSHGGKHIHSEEDEEHAHNDSMWKGLVAMVGVVFFYFTEKGLNLIAEWRKRRMRLDKENKLPTRVRVMRNDIGCLKGSGSCSSKTGSSGFLKLPNAMNLLKPGSNKQGSDSNNAVQNSKICKHKYSEYPYCYDEIATDTHDDHHVRDGKQSSIAKETKATNENHKDGNNDDLSLSVVSSNNLEETPSTKQEPTANDSLLSGDSTKAVQKGIISNNRLQPQDYAGKEEFSADLDGVKRGLDMNNGGKKRIGVKTVDGHTRSRSADRATELEDLDSAKRGNQEESYTVILREHSQTHHGHSHSHGHVHSPPSSLSSVVWMVIMGDGLHNFTDGMAIGAAFSSNIAGGFSTAIAVLCHELPHEIGDFAVLLKAGMSAKRAVCYNLLSSILCLLGMVVGVVAGHAPEATGWIFAAAAGMFMYIALVDMIPELSSSHAGEGSICQCILQLLGLSTGIGIMLLIAMYEHDLKKLFG